MSRIVKVVFTLSILLNLVLAGVIAGAVMHKIQSHPLRQAAKDFSPESQNLIARNFQDARRDMRDTFRELRSAVYRIDETMQAKTFDPEEFNRAAEKLSDIQGRMLERRLDIIRELGTALPPEEREKLGMKLLRRLRDHPEDGGESICDETL